MTLYRTSGDTKVIDYLVDAAQNGKQVAVVVELKARFDEAANIRWSSRLEEAGIHVTYGVVDLKTHCKLILVVRNDYSGLRRYVHIGTGNYHAGNARLYTELGLLTWVTLLILMTVWTEVKPIFQADWAFAILVFMVTLPSWPLYLIAYIVLIPWPDLHHRR